MDQLSDLQVEQKANDCARGLVQGLHEINRHYPGPNPCRPPDELLPFFVATFAGLLADRYAIIPAVEVTAEPTVGRIYKGTVRRIVDFGAFVEILPGTDGLLHISQIGPGRVERIADVLHEGDEVTVKVLEIDSRGRARLSIREAQREFEK